MNFLSNIIKNNFRSKQRLSLLEQLEDELKKIKENLVHSQELARIGSWTYNLQTDEIFLTEEVYRILDRTPQEFDGKLENYYLFIHPDDLEKVKEAAQAALAGREDDIECRIITKDGTIKYINQKMRALSDENNNPAKIVAIIQDITNYKLIEKNLREIGDSLNQAQRVAGVGSWRYDVKQDKYFGTEEMFRIYEIEPSEFNGDFSSTISLIHPEDQFLITEAMKMHLEGQSSSVEFRIPQKDGTNKYVLAKGKPIFNDNGELVEVVGTLQDITEKKRLEQELRKVNRILGQAESLAHIGSWEMDLNSYETYYSDEAYKVFGISPDQFDGTYEGFLKRVHPDDVKIIESLINNPSDKPVILEFRWIRPDGSVRNIYEMAEFVFDAEGKPFALYGTIQDITEIKELEKQIESKQKEIDKINRRFKVLVQESNDVFEILATDGTITYISDAAEKVIGLKPEERLGKKVYEYYSEEDSNKIRQMIATVIMNPKETVQDNVVFLAKNGEKIHLEVNMKNLLNEPAIEGIVVNFRDISKRLEMEEQMVYKANHDDLTGLPNGVYFKKELIRQCKCANDTQNGFALMMLDIDGFKYINDALGYALGDQLIIQAADRLVSFFDDTCFVCRYSADRFAIFLPGLNTIDEYEKTAKSIVELFSRTFNVDKYQLDVTISIGVSIHKGDGEDAETLAKHAEIALFWAKNSGKNIYKFYSADISIQDYKQFELRNDLRRAMEDNQFRVVYQPMVNLNTNNILAAEALIRWEHHVWGTVSPNEFISLAEQTGLITNIGNWILREVCEHYRSWLDKGLPDIKVSINFSCIQFLEQDFVENIMNTIKEYQLDPGFLIMEITESLLMKNTEKAMADIKRLQSYGIQVALDDFGTGFSSLAYLNSFKIDFLKIDGSFIKNSITDEKSSIITKSIINMARELKIKLVAEGIENFQQLSYLKGLNCLAGQGYLYSRPIPPEDFEVILAKKKCIPVLKDDAIVMPLEERRKFFRVNFPLLLEADLTVIEFKGRKVEVGNTKVVIKNMGPGGLCFISDIRLPVVKDIILQFTAQLLEEDFKVYGCPVWTQEIDNNIFEYGVQFTFDENERAELIRILNQVEIKMKNNILFSEGSFVSISPEAYFMKHFS